MKKLLLLGVLSLLFSCGSRDDDNKLSGNNGTGTSITNQGSGIGKVDFTFNGKDYSYINYNTSETSPTGLIQNTDFTKPFLKWITNSDNNISILFQSNYPININGIYMKYIVVDVAKFKKGDLIRVSQNDGTPNGTITTDCTNPKITYTIDSKNRISGSFTSDQCSGTFKDIIKGKF